MKIYISTLKFDKPTILEEEIDFSNVENPISQIKRIAETKVKATINRYDEFIQVDFNIETKLIAISSYTSKEGELNLKFSDSVTLSMNEEQDDYDVIKGNMLELDNYVFSLILGEVPIKVVFKGEKLPLNEDSNVISEDELEKKKKENKSSPFDVLDKLF